MQKGNSDLKNNAIINMYKLAKIFIHKINISINICMNKRTQDIFIKILYTKLELSTYFSTISFFSPSE